MANDITWIVIVESASARIFQTVGQSARNLRHVRDFHHPAGRLKEQSFTSDRPGRVKVNVTPTRHGLSEAVSASEQENLRFFSEIARFIEASFDQNIFSHLILIAPAHVLGVLRQKIPEKIRRCLLRELNKDIPSWMDQRDVSHRLISDLELR